MLLLLMVKDAEEKIHETTSTTIESSGTQSTSKAYIEIIKRG
jgi:hypothetical protein